MISYWYNIYRHIYVICGQVESGQAPAQPQTLPQVGLPLFLQIECPLRSELIDVCSCFFGRKLFLLSWSAETCCFYRVCHGRSHCLLLLHLHHRDDVWLLVREPAEHLVPGTAPRSCRAQVKFGGRRLISEAPCHIV